MSELIDVTDKVDFQNNDDECLPLTKCVCGKEYKPWNFTISMYDGYPVTRSCPACGRKLCFKIGISFYEVM